MREVHRMTPLVAGCGKLRLLLARRTAEFQRRAIRLDERAMDEIARRFANKILPVQTGQCVVLINHRPAGGGEPAARLAFRRAVAGVVVFEIRRVIRAFLPPRMRLRNRVGPPVAGVGFERGRGRIGITREIAPRNRRDADAGRSRRHRETPASFRHRETEGLRVARHWFNRAAVCANAKVGARQLDGRDQMRPRDFSTAPAAPEINPAIRAPLRRIDATLQLAGRKAAEQFLPHLGPAIAIAVREENDVRRAGDDDSTARGHESIDRRQIGSPHLRRIHAPIAVGVAQHFHHPESARIRRLLKLLPRLHPAHLRVQRPRLVQFLDVQLPREIVAVQLAHKHPPAFIPAHRRRRRDERFAGDDLHPKTLRQLEGCRALLGRHRLRRVRRLRDLPECVRGKRHPQQEQSGKRQTGHGSRRLWASYRARQFIRRSESPLVFFRCLGRQTVTCSPRPQYILCELGWLS